jgi:hypothetical protein
LAWASARPSPALSLGAGFFYAWRFGSAKISLATRHPARLGAGSGPQAPTPQIGNGTPISHITLSDVGAFTEKSEITVTHKTSDDLRKAIQSKIQRLLDMEVIDVEAKSVEEELGLIEDEYSGTTDTTDQDTQTS